MRFGLPEKVLQLIIDCLSGFPEIKRAVIFGSRATGKYRAGSDIDIALWIKSDNPLLTGQIAAALDELPTPYMYDVIDYKAITHLPLKTHIDCYGKELKSAK